MTMSDLVQNDAAARRAPIVTRKPLLYGLCGLFAFVAFLRAYEQLFGWSAGIDSFSPEFQTYWMSLLQAAAVIEPLGLVGLAVWLWRTRDRAMTSLTAATEMQRYVHLVQWLTVFAFALYFGLSFFTEQGAVWHMTAIRDTDFTPSNIVTYYIAYPLFSILGVGAFLYARTRLPAYARGFSLPFVVLVVGAFMTIPNVGLNEWGHTCWSMDENFAGPLHWGFVFFGWMALGMFGVVLQILMRLRDLLGRDGVDLILRR